MNRAIDLCGAHKVPYTDGNWRVRYLSAGLLREGFGISF